ncbi:aminotransferase class IV [Aurantimonas endophytica]|uniref:Probable branched-chain-amino-acid aminotransferase n=1 Tax=Aurantimonas endophytica TaxID=1522175 RepID=A0A7W6MP59_9HYPH|nr:aminotransferase class IV [Aurantimonas endophytica]MBB4002537.1 branched-chain amino acid aminotransferase [Aurantimonas endophytica]MCO6403418.1 class IV aminotransferase [Aurantimonas endophytica]
MADIWLDGAFVAAERAVAADDRGLLLADGVFDTSLVLGGTVFCADAHLDRLAAAASRLEIPASRRDLADAMDALARRQENGSIRLTLTRGSGPRGLGFPPVPKPTLLGASAPLAPGVMFAPLRLALSPIRRNETSPTAQLKSLAYLDAVLAQRAAQQEGADEALFLNSVGRVACTALANLFLLTGDELATPPLDDGALDGITRRWVLAHAADFGLTPRERPLALDDLTRGSVFVTNSLRLIAPATLPGRPEGLIEPRIGRLMHGLCTAIAAECGVDPRDLGATIDPG